MSHNGGPMIENLSREITANGADGMNVMNTHNVRANRRVNGAQHEHYVRITMEQKERARACEACTKVSGAHARARTHTTTIGGADVTLLLLSISPTGSPKC